MRYASICSGVSPHSKALAALGWQSVFVSEIESAPSAVLAYHYPDVPNLGDFTKIDGTQYRGKVDVLMGSTPCQAFSVAGLRNSLNDDRGNLTLEFTKLVERIDPRVTLWENVPGVLSTADNAFGCFLGGLVGADTALVCPRGQRWTNAGYATGPRRRVAWRVLDAQGDVPQRRRRVFVLSVRNDLRLDPRRVLFETEAEVVGSFGDSACPEEVFLKLKSLRWDTAAGGEEGQGVAGDAQDGADECCGVGGGHVDTVPALTASGRGVERTGESRGQDPVIAVIPETVGTLSDGAQKVWPEVAMPVMARDYKGPRNYQDGGLQNAVVVGGSFDDAIAFRAFGQEGFTPSEVCPPVAATDGGGAGVPTICFSAKDHGADAAPEQKAVLMRNREGCAGGGKGPLLSEELSLTIAANTNDQVLFQPCYAVRTAQTSANGHGVAEEVTHTLDGAQGQAIAVHTRNSNMQGDPSSNELAWTLDERTHAVCYPALQAGKQHAVGVEEPQIFESRFARNGRGAPEEICPLLKAQSGETGKGDAAPLLMTPQMAVRRLTPVETTRLMGWEELYLHIPTSKWRTISAEEGRYLIDHGLGNYVESRGQWRTCIQADGPMYKGCGNGWVNPVVVRICRRIDDAIKRTE